MMRNTFLCLMAATLLSGCGAIRSPSKDTYRAEVNYTLFGYPGVSQTVNFASDGKDITALAFSGRDGSAPIDKRSSDSFHTDLLVLNPKLYDKLRGTDLFHDIKLVVTYHLNESHDGNKSIHFSGSMDYMSSLSLQNCPAPACVGGTVAKHLSVSGDVSVVQGVPSTYELPNGLQMSVVLEPSSHLEAN